MTWCKDIERDAAVRAAEDGRSGPLPTLGEAIARPFAKVAERSVPVSKTGKVQSGLRTERVVLEITYGGTCVPIEVFASNCVQSTLRALHGDSGESVRVVEETHFDDLAQVAMERDAAISERDKFRQIAQTFESLCLGEQARNKVLKARVAELEAERDSAIREREELRSEITSVRNCWGVSRFANDVLKARVAELEAERDSAIREREDLREQLESVACRAADAEMALEAASGGGEGEAVAWGVVQSGSVVTTRLKEHEAKKASEVWLSSTVVPLYRSPPQTRGWLTGEEREIIAGIADDDEYTEEGQNIAKGLLARSTPPDVVLPKLHTRCEVHEANNKSPCLWFRRPDVVAALAAAGVAVKEVGRE